MHTYHRRNVWGPEMAALTTIAKCDMNSFASGVSAE